WAIGPVWEANHVWLIFVLVVLWTAFSVAFQSVMSTLFIPLSLAALGIVLRGSGFAFHKQARRGRYQRFAELLFDVSSLLTPFFMGTVVGAIASGQVPVGNAAGDPVSSWTGAAPLITGALFVATGAYLSAVFLVSDARRAHDPDMERYFATRALAAAVVAGAIAIAGLVIYHADARYIYDGLVGDALPLVIVSVVCGAAVLAMLWRGGRRGTLGLGSGAAPVSAAEVADHLAGGRDGDHPGGRPDRVRGGDRDRAAGAGVPVHAHPAKRPRGRRRGSPAPDGRGVENDAGMIGERTIDALVALTLESPDADLEAAFVPNAGMVGCSLRHRGEELLGQRGGLARYVAERSTMGIPLLHPWANRLGSRRFEVLGREVNLDLAEPPPSADPNGLPIHGLLSAARGWQVTRSAASDDGGTIAARFDFAAHEGLLRAFPFPH
ncbi:MAG: hypothetical protein E6G49_07730, partial [Actinobacteria bacterium]